MPFGMMGKALGGLGNKMMNAPGMGAIRKPLQAGMKAPGMKPVAKGLGLGPSQSQQPEMQPQPQPAPVNWGPNNFQPGQRVGQAAMSPMQQPPVSQQPPPAAAPSSPPQQMNPEQATPEMQDQKLQQMAAMFGQMSPSGMAQPHVMPRFGQMGGFGGAMQGGAALAGGMMRNKMQQMVQQRRGGIGPSQQPQQMQQQEPEMY